MFEFSHYLQENILGKWFACTHRHTCSLSPDIATKGRTESDVGAVNRFCYHWLIKKEGQDIARLEDIDR